MRIMGELTGKTALVTGASSGFGLLICLELAGQGYQVAAGMRRPEGSDRLLSLAREAGLESRIHVVTLDICEPELVKNAVLEIEKLWGRLDLLVNNAGEAVGGFVEEVPLEAWRKQMDVNFFGTVSVTQAALPLIRRTGKGRIIFMSSISGVVGFPGYGPYASSKFAVEGFGECLSLELQPLGIDVVLIEPGAYGTAIWSKGFSDISAQEGSPYRAMLDDVLNFSKATAKSSGDPREVAHLVGEIARMKSPRFRYRLPKGTRMTVTAKLLLPYRMFQRIVLKTLSRKR
ncbi:NADP-dependent 3-hydroxy acid dehydrogenase YdfG [Paenibacillus uliginis N3/975]|uniref:NADP-dependent 3-hydroxy acid dehydrogenase YdfG n=1 Tax=Paenibacillus uliginis N3/975 TaxID=1313296 RepID=A0A1X7GN60_9BACL|nr:NADP-dependent 3-hydroxy acid dehydrogenase YdfG [Paenibacillus uliginis N3/975]